MGKIDNYHIELKKVDIQYQQKPILQEVSMVLPANNILAIVGPDEQAKKAFLRLFNKLYLQNTGWQVKGKIRLNGKNINKVPLKLLRRNVGLIQAEPAVFPGSIWDNLVIGLRIQNTYNAQKTTNDVKQILQKLNVWEDLRDELDGKFSYINLYLQQMVCLARMLLLSPQLLLLERPTLHLPELQKAQFEEIIYNLKHDYTIIFMPEDYQQAARLSDKAAFFYNGMLLDFSETKKMFVSPENPIVQSYLIRKV